MSVFDKMTKDEIQVAQNKLNALCDKIEFKHFNIKHNYHQNKKWQALVFNLCGIQMTEPKPRGRPKDPKISEAGLLAYLDTEYFNIDPNTGKKIPQHTLFKRIIDETNIQSTPKEHGYTDPHNTVKKALNNLRKKMKEHDNK